jgi:hypothetical protein
VIGDRQGQSSAISREPRNNVMTSLPLSPDAAMVLALAGPALRFADSADAEAERWLRTLRLHGQAAGILQGLGIGEARLSAAADGFEREIAHQPDQGVNAVVGRAEECARQRGATLIRTADLLVAVMRCYPRAFARALESRGSDRWELTERLVESLHAPLR